MFTRLYMHIVISIAALNCVALQKTSTQPCVHDLLTITNNKEIFHQDSLKILKRTFFLNIEAMFSRYYIRDISSFNLQPNLKDMFPC